MSIRDRQLCRAGDEKPEIVDLPAAGVRRSTFEVVQTGRLAVKVTAGLRIEIHFSRDAESETAALSVTDSPGTYYVWRKYTYATGVWTDWAVGTPDTDDPARRVFVQAEVIVSGSGGTNRITGIIPHRTGDVEVYRRKAC